MGKNFREGIRSDGDDGIRKGGEEAGGGHRGGSRVRVRVGFGGGGKVTNQGQGASASPPRPPSSSSFDCPRLEDIAAEETFFWQFA